MEPAHRDLDEATGSGLVVGAGEGAQPTQALAPFISKLYEIISTAAPADCIKWGPLGDTIVVTDQSKFAREVLPRFFKHDNIRSFIRQLNIYGFQRCRNPDRSGSVEGEHGELEFYHEKFVEGRKDLMRQITRGMPSRKSRPLGAPAGDATPPSDAPMAPITLSSEGQQIMSEITWIKQHIGSISSQLRSQAEQVQARLATLVQAIGPAAQPAAQADAGADGMCM